MVTLARPEFTHLHVASSYSLRYGTATPRRWPPARPTSACPRSR